jgi:hypothetical protein
MERRDQMDVMLYSVSGAVARIDMREQSERCRLYKKRD